MSFTLRRLLMTGMSMAAALALLGLLALFGTSPDFARNFATWFLLGATVAEGAALITINLIPPPAATGTTSNLTTPPRVWDPANRDHRRLQSALMFGAWMAGMAVVFSFSGFAILWWINVGKLATYIWLAILFIGTIVLDVLAMLRIRNIRTS